MGGKPMLSVVVTDESSEEVLRSEPSSPRLGDRLSDIKTRGSKSSQMWTKPKSRTRARSKSLRTKQKSMNHVMVSRSHRGLVLLDRDSYEEFGNLLANGKTLGFKDLVNFAGSRRLLGNNRVRHLAQDRERVVQSWTPRRRKALRD